MKTAILIACASKKRPHRAAAAELYTSDLFKKNLAYARSLHPDAIYILSAKYGVLALDEEVDTYNQTLNTMRAKEVEAWAAGVEGALRKKIDFDKDRVVFLAGERYRKHLLPLMAHAEVPLQGLGIGRQLRYLKHALR